MTKNYEIRKNCIFCTEKLTKTYFEKDLFCFTAHYSVDFNQSINSESMIPYNIYLCNKCKTSQTKYLGDLNEIYKNNHADSTGKVMRELHNFNLNFILKHKNNISNIIEIGSSKGVLADLILEKIDTEYYIVEPSFNGDRSNKKILEDFYENIDDTNINANTLIISHVFEHFYEPRKILEKISKNKNIENFFLVFPDFEYYIDNDVLHILNSEHTFYVDNSFLVNLLRIYGFKLQEQTSYIGHSTLFYFKREKEYNYLTSSVNFSNQKYDLTKYFNKIQNIVAKFNTLIEQNKDKNIYIWPSSAHTMRLFEFGLHKLKLTGMLDNSILKIGKRMYGCNLPIYDFNEITKTCKQAIILLNGGIFNNEVEDQLKQANIEYYSSNDITEI